jgi:fatty-acid desaturase
MTIYLRVDRLAVGELVAVAFRAFSLAHYGEETRNNTHSYEYANVESASWWPYWILNSNLIYSMNLLTIGK